jgi:ATP-binding cassette subfamily C protein
MATLLQSMFEAEGEAQTLGGNNPLLLADPESVWLLVEGKAEVFSVAQQGGTPYGPRRHFTTVAPGELLFGVDLERDGEGLGFLVVGVVGTRVYRLPMPRLRALAGNGAGPEVADAVGRWIEGLSAGVTKGIVPRPRADVRVDAGEQAVLADGRRLRPNKGVVWASHVQGASLFIGMEEVGGTDDGGHFPVSAEAWLQATGAAEVATIDTHAAVASGTVWNGLERFHATLFRCEFFNARLGAVDELNRLREKAQRDDRARQGALETIHTVLEPARAKFRGIEHDDPLLAAASLVGRELGIVIQAPPKPKGEDSTPSDPIQEMVRASGIRARQVVLKDDWYAQDAGPFLGFMEEGMLPVAILPTSMTTYEVCDPSRGSREPLTPALIEKLHGRAWTFYRPFPDKKLTPAEVLRFAASSVSLSDKVRPVIVGVGAGILGMVSPYFMGMLVDTVIPEASRNQLVQLAMILAVVGFTTAMFDIVRGLSLQRIEARMSATVQPAMWDRLLSLPVAFFRKYSSGDLAQRAGGIDAIRRVLSGATLATVMTAIFSLFNYCMLFYYSWQLALVATGVVVLALAATLASAYAKIRIQTELMEVEGRISGLVLQLLAGMAKVRVTGAEGRAFAVWAREFSRQKALSFRTGRIENWLAVFNAAFPVAGAMLVFWCVIWFMKGESFLGKMTLSPGDFVAFNSAFGIFLQQSLQMGLAILSVLLILPIFERARPILEAKGEVDSTKVDPGELAGSIEVSHVTFRYHPDGPPVLSDVSLKIEPGEFVAIVGPSGSGKSTLLRAMLGLEVPESGAVYFDGRDLSQIDVQKLRRRIGVVSQNGVIRAGSIFVNIVGSSPLTQDDAWTAARMAGLEDDVKAMPMQLNTMLQQGGPTLSGGQRQRLMIARAIVTRPRVLFFDEATSALDNRTQSIVSRSIERLQATRIAVAHRLSTIAGADRIYVMAGGRIVQVGSYQELSEKEGLFQDLIRRQMV